jgi:hypothetical protein
MQGKQIHTPIWFASIILAGVLVVGGAAGALAVRRGSSLGLMPTLADCAVMLLAVLSL